MIIMRLEHQNTFKDNIYLDTTSNEVALAEIVKDNYPDGPIRN